MDTLNLDRTRAALALYDEKDAALGALTGDEPSETIDAAIEARDAALTAIGEAFADDTADRNDPATARTVANSLAGLAFVRRLCADAPEDREGDEDEDEDEDGVDGAAFALGALRAILDQVEAEAEDEDEDDEDVYVVDGASVDVVFDEEDLAVLEVLHGTRQRAVRAAIDAIANALEAELEGSARPARVVCRYESSGVERDEGGDPRVRDAVLIGEAAAIRASLGFGGDDA